MKTDRVFVVNAKTGYPKRTRLGKALVVDYNEVPARCIRAWEKQGFVFAKGAYTMEAGHQQLMRLS
jgi:hypothetical protein